MTNTSFSQQSDDSSLWLESLVNGLAGLRIKAKHPVYCGASPFQKIEVYDTYGYGRILVLAGTIVLTEKDEFIYNEMITHPAMTMQKKPKNVCIIGGGDGGVLRQVLKYNGVQSVTVVEIDQLVVKTIRKHFPALGAGFRDKRVKLVIDDGCRYLEKTRDKFDVILVDSFDPGGPVQSLLSGDFYQLAGGHISPEGIVVFQTGSPTVKPEQVRAAIASISPLFPAFKLYCCVLPSFPEAVCSFLICAVKNGILGSINEKRYESIADSCRYYNRDIHTGAFLLPGTWRSATA